MACLDLLQRVVVVDELRRIVEIDQYLGVAVWQETVDRVSMLDALKIDEHVNEFIERRSRDVDLVDHCEWHCRAFSSIPQDINNSVTSNFPEYHVIFRAFLTVLGPYN